MKNDRPHVNIVGMIGTQRESAANAGATVSVFGGGINPGSDIPQGIDPDYILEFAQVHENSGFDMVLTGYSSSTPDGFEVTSYAAAHTRRIGFLIAHRPGFVTPTLAARKIATLDQLTKGRIALHIISGGSDKEQRSDGDWIGHDDRYRRTDEYMGLLTRIWDEYEPFNHEGEFYKLEGAYSQVRCFQSPRVPLFFGGASDIALDVGSKRADVFALWGEPLSEIKDRITNIRNRAQSYNRDIKFSLSVRPVLGKTEAAAWDRAQSILDHVKHTTLGKIEPGQPARLQSEGSRRLLKFAKQGDLHDDRLWMPIAAASGAAGSTTCLVGTAEQVADSLSKYFELGCDTFIIRGFDPIADAKEYGEDLIPLIRQKASNLG